MEKLTINLNGEFTAADLDDVLRELANARAQMEPAVQDTPPNAIDAEAIEPLPAKSFAIRNLTSGGLRFWFRHAGFGWLGYTVGPEHREALGEFIAKPVGHSVSFQ